MTVASRAVLPLALMGGVADGMVGHVVANGVDYCASIGDKFAAVVQRVHDAVCQLARNGYRLGLILNGLDLGRNGRLHLKCSYVFCEI